MLTLVGMNHRSAPLDLRERLALSPAEAHAALERLRSDTEVREAFVLSTCNRIEYLVRASTLEAGSAIDRFLKSEYGIERSTLDKHAYRRSGRDAIRHVFRVTAGLDSMILGEPQIQGQVKEAFATSRESGSSGVVVDRLLQHALSAAKRARSETGISRHAVSVASAAVKLAQKIFGKLNGRRVLMLGAGKMGELVARHLHRQGIEELVVCSRRFDNADRAARRFGGRAVHWDDGVDQLRNVDIVIGCTGAPHPVLSREQVAKASRGRRSGPLFLIDIAVPRDIDSSVHSLENVYLYDIDALESVVDDNLDERRRAAELAKQLVDHEVDSFERWLHSQAVAPLIAAMRTDLMAVGERELERFRGRLGALTEPQEQALREMTRAMMRKFLDRPTRYLRDSAQHGEAARVAEMLRDAFGLELAEDEDADSKPGPHRLLKGGRDDS